MEKTNYRLEIIFDSDTPPRNIDSKSVEVALLTALVISIGGNITVKGGDMKLSVWNNAGGDNNETTDCKK